MGDTDQILQRAVDKWLHKAEQDLKVAEILLSSDSDVFEQIAFHCQQAAEKFVKAYLTARRVAFPKSHDLGELLDLMLTVNKELADKLYEIDRLNPMAVEARYPSEAVPMTASDARRALELARITRDAILPLLKP